MRIFLIFGMLISFLCDISGAAAEFPDKPVRMIVPSTPGGPADIIARLTAEELTKKWRQPVVIDNKPGANAVIGVKSVTTSAPDGYTLLMSAAAVLTIYQALAGNPAFDSVKDLTPISSAASSTLVLVASASAPFQDIAGLVKFAKAHPGELSYASAGVGAMNHIGAELFKMKTGTDLIHVPYKGDAPSVSDLIAGRVTIAFLSSNLAIPQVRDGQLKGLAVTSETRSEFVPELPTVSEAGIAGFVLKPWNAVLGPPGMANELVQKINRDLADILGSEETKRKFNDIGMTAESGTPGALRSTIQNEIEMWRSVIQTAGIAKQ